jgi:hypothetical protein
VLPDGVATLEFMPALFNARAGAFDLDDLRLTPLPAEEIARLRPPEPPALEKPDPEKFPPEVFAKGNRLRAADDREVWLQGVNVASLEWKPRGEHVLRSIVTAIEDWKASVIRLPVHIDFWYDVKDDQKDGGKAYRDLVDAAITLAANRGVYVILDHHRYRAPRPEHLDFWRDAATRYKNHPAVLFGLLNEPHGTTWDVWLHGGYVQERKMSADDETTFLTEEERIRANIGYRSPGIQRLLDAVHATGARNLAVIGGLEYAYDLSGILNGYAVTDNGGNGIMYDTHVYPWKYNWREKFLDAAEKHPVLVGEVGADIKKQSWERELKPPEIWVPDMLGLIQKHRLNWTGWCFHPSAGPKMLLNWSYEPTPYWGAYAKRALAGEQFELKNLR